MREPENIQHVPINENRGFVTNSDSVKLSENYAEDMSGFRITTPGVIAQRDEGTRNRFFPNLYPRTKRASDPSLASLVDGGGTTLFDQSTKGEHHIVVGLDREAPPRLRVFVNTDPNEAGAWEDLTRISHMENAGIASFPTSSTIRIAKVNLVEDGAHADQDDSLFTGWMTGGFSQWYAFNKTRWDLGTVIGRNMAVAKMVSYTDPGGGNLDVLMYEQVRDIGGPNNGWQAGDFVWFFRTRALIAEVTDLGTDLVAVWNHIEANRKANLHLWKDASTLAVGQIPLRIQKRDAIGLFFTFPNPNSYVQLDSWKGRWVIGTIYAPEDGVEWGSPVQSYSRIAAHIGDAETSATEPGIGADWQTHWAQSAASITMPAGWYMEEVEQNIATQRIGTSDTAIPPSAAVQTLEFSEVVTDLRWLKLSMDVANGPVINRDGSQIIMMYWYITVLYDDTQESDPIAQGYTESTNTPNVGESPIVNFTFNISLGKMNQHVSGLRIWGATLTTLERTAGRKELADGEYRLNRTIYFRKDNGSGVTIQRGITTNGDRTISIGYNMGVASGAWEFIYADVPVVGIVPVGARLNQAPETTLSVTDGLGHAIIRKRKRYTPRYAVRGARYQSAISLIDGDDNTVLASCYSGPKVHMDDIYTEAVVDNNYFTQKIVLASRGELMGIGFHDSKAIAFKRSEFEYYDFRTKEQRIVTGDCVSRRGIVLTPDGYVIAGSRAITILRYDNGQDTRFNFDWLNLWDGRLKMLDGTPFITEEYRKNSVLWYSPFYNELLVHVQVNLEGVGSRWECLRYSFTEHKWGGRRYFNVGNSGKIRYFANKNDKTLVIGTDGGIYKYPNQDGAHIYQDKVPLADTAGNSMEARIIQNLGSIHRISSEFSIYSIAHDTVADVLSGNGLLNVEVLPERSAAMIGGTSKRPANQKATPVGLGKYGKFRAARVLTELPAGNENNFGKFDISMLDVGVVIDSRKGNA